METFKEFLSKIENEENRNKLASILDFIQNRFSQLKQ